MRNRVASRVYDARFVSPAVLASDSSNRRDSIEAGWLADELVYRIQSTKYKTKIKPSLLVVHPATCTHNSYEMHDSRFDRWMCIMLDMGLLYYCLYS